MGRRTAAQREKRNERERQRYADDPEYREKRLASANVYKALHRDERNAQLRHRYATDNEFREATLARNRTGNLKATLERKHGKSLEDYEKMLAGQGRRCLICEEEFSCTPDLDHDHDSGELRGLLCRRCNLGLGHFDDNPVWLRRAADHVERRLQPSADPRQLRGPHDTDRMPDDAGSGQLIRRAILQELDRPPGFDQPPPADKLQQIVRALINKACERNMSAIGELLDRLDARA